MKREGVNGQGYEPFGALLPGRNYSSSSYNYGFNGKLKDDEIHGATGTSYDFGARIYGSREGRWLSLDPKASKYPSLSPYAFVGNSPLNAIDPDGRDIVVLNYGYTPDPQHWNNHLVGHQAVLIGNDKDGWTYYSYDADEGANGRQDAQGGNDNFTAGLHFNSLEEFANSEHNTFKDDYDDGRGLETAHRNGEGEIIQRYQQGFRITTSAEVDERMRNAANATFDESYNLLTGSECTAVPRNALDAGGLANGEYTDTHQRDPQNYGETIKEKNLLPVTKQREIERSNPGVDVDRQLQRAE